MKRLLSASFAIAVGVWMCLSGPGARAAIADYEGSILLDVERHGEAYYLYQGGKYFLGRPAQAFDIMRGLSLGISEETFTTGFRQVNTVTKIFRIVNTGLYPTIQGRIVIRPAANGEAYYVMPNLAAGNGYQAEYLGTASDAFAIMQRYGQGVSSAFIDAIPTRTIASSPCVPGVDANCTSSGKPRISAVSDGTVHSGQRVTLTGSAFGAKSRPRPLIWDTFEDGAAGKLIRDTKPVIGSAWSVWANGRQPRYSKTLNRDNSTRNALFEYSASLGYTKFLQYYTNVNTAYFTFWWRYDKTSEQWSANLKPWIEYGTQGNCPGIYSGFGAPPSDAYLRPSVVDCDAEGVGYQLNDTMYGWLSYDSTIDEIEGQWVRMEVFAKQSSAPGVADGSMRMWVHKPDGEGITLDIKGTNIVTRDTVNEWYQWWILGAYHTSDERSPLATGEVRGDDIYFDRTQARIEIGNTSKWSTNTHREIQIPHAWSATSATFTVNQGSFADGEQAYVFLVDANGKASNGYPVRFE